MQQVTGTEPLHSLVVFHKVVQLLFFMITLTSADQINSLQREHACTGTIRTCTSPHMCTRYLVFLGILT